MTRDTLIAWLLLPWEIVKAIALVIYVIAASIWRSRREGTR